MRIAPNSLFGNLGARSRYETQHWGAISILIPSKYLSLKRLNFFEVDVPGNRDLYMRQLHAGSHRSGWKNKNQVKISKPKKARTRWKHCNPGVQTIIKFIRLYAFKISDFKKSPTPMAKTTRKPKHLPKAKIFIKPCSGVEY